MDSTPQEYDVVVLGTGAAGLTAAIAEADAGARVAVFEKAEKVGGTAAWSGGMVWVPQNAHMAELGLSDSREQAMTLPCRCRTGSWTRRWSARSSMPRPRSPSSWRPRPRCASDHP